MHLFLALLFSVTGLAAVIISPAKFVSFDRFADPPEREPLDDLHRTTFVNPRSES